MSEWVDFSIYAAMTAVFWFAFVGWSAGLASFQIVADRNEEWLKANHERAVARFCAIDGSSGAPGFCGRVMRGALSASPSCSRASSAPGRQLWSSGTDGSQQWEVLKDTHSTLLIVGLLYYLGVVVISSRRVQKTSHSPKRGRRRSSHARSMTLRRDGCRWEAISSSLFT